MIGKASRYLNRSWIFVAALIAVLALSACDRRPSTAYIFSIPASGSAGGILVELSTIASNPGGEYWHSSNQGRNFGMSNISPRTMLYGRITNSTDQSLTISDPVQLIFQDGTVSSAGISLELGESPSQPSGLSSTVPAGREPRFTARFRGSIEPSDGPITVVIHGVTMSDLALPESSTAQLNREGYLPSIDYWANLPPSLPRTAD